MKLLPIYWFLISYIFLSCQQFKEKNQSIIIDNKIADKAKNKIRLFPDKDISYFKTRIFTQFYINDKLNNTINYDSSSMMSWYSISRDTIDLVVHIGDGFGTTALLLRFLNGSIKVMLLRAAHDPRPLFKLNQKDSFADIVEVPARKYLLQLSEIPNLNTKKQIYGFIDMESGDYYKKKESDDNCEKKDSGEIKNRYILRFYFKSQYRHFDFLK